ncbi:MAG TPA: glycosyltransferase [Blastocatellia bacterium]
MRGPRCDRAAESDSGSIEFASTAKQVVVHVTWSLVAGGSEMYAFTIASNLDPNRYKSFICAMDRGGPLEADVRASGIPYRVINRPPGIHPSLIWRLFALFRRTSATVVHAHHFNQLLYSAIGAKLAGAKLIYTEHSVEYLKARRFRVALRLLSILCDSVIAISEDGRKVLLEKVGIPAGKVQIIRAGISMSQLAPSRADARQQLGLDTRDRIAVIVARLYPEKNHILLLDAFARVVKRVPRAKLLIVGEGTEREAIERHVEKLGLNDFVALMGVRRDVQRILAASDLFVLSSDREGLPIAVIEAMSMSRPVVATRVGDLPELITDGITGRMVEPRDIDGFAKAVGDVLGDPETAARMGKRAQGAVRDTFSLALMIDRFETLYCHAPANLRSSTNRACFPKSH